MLQHTPLALVALLALGCARKDQNARGTPNRSSSVGGSSPAITRSLPNLASAIRQAPLRTEEASRPLPGHDGPGSAPQKPIELDTLALPSGFPLQASSDQVPNARALALGAKGTVYVSTRTDGRVYALLDDDGDHKVDRVSIVARGPDTPKPVVSADKRRDEKQHGWRYIRFGLDGWLYIPIGAPCDTCKPEGPIISRVRAPGAFQGSPSSRS